MFEGHQKILLTQDWITIIFMVELVFFAILKILYSERFSGLFTLNFSDRYYNEYTKNKPVIFNFFNILLSGIFAFNVSLLLLYFFNSFKFNENNYQLGFYTDILAAVLAFMLLRYLIGLVVAGIMERYNDYKYLTFLKISNLSLTAIYLFPLLILINYTPLSMRRMLTVMVLGFILIYMLTRYISILRNDKVNFNTLFYLFLYLCALEITPFIIAYKLFVN